MHAGRTHLGFASRATLDAPGTQPHQTLDERDPTDRTTERGQRVTARRHTVSSVSPRALVIDDETPVARTRRARKMYRSLHERYPYAHCELDFTHAARAARRDASVGPDVGVASAIKIAFPAAARVLYTAS